MTKKRENIMGAQGGGMRFGMHGLRAGAFLVLGVLGVVMAACGMDDNSYTVVDTIRTPILQLLQKPSGGASDASRPGCVSLPTGDAGAEERWCQQFPLRPATEVIARFVLLAPASATALTLSFKDISQLRNIDPASRAARIPTQGQDNAVAVDLTKWSFTERSALNKVVSESPLRIEERYYSWRLPDADTLLADVQRGALPAFNLNYTSEAPGLRIDRGFVAFVVLPEPDSPIIEAILNGSIGGTAADDSQREALLQAAKTNTPPAFVSFSPDGGEVSAGGENRLEVTLGTDPDAGAKSRIQWFVSAGELSNPVSRRPKWKPKNNGPAAAFVMVRDLQGGSDYAFRNFLAR